MSSGYRRCLAECQKNLIFAIFPDALCASLGGLHYSESRGWLPRFRDIDDFGRTLLVSQIPKRAKFKQSLRLFAGSSERCCLSSHYAGTKYVSGLKKPYNLEIYSNLRNLSRFISTQGNHLSVGAFLAARTAGN